VCDALIVVDVQRDFCLGGALAVPRGDEVVPVLNQLLRAGGFLKVATRDWHPPAHCSFHAQGGPWPPHCVQGAPGAEFHPSLEARRIDLVVSKGTDAGREAYSGFDAPGLVGALRERGIGRLWIGGLALEYCVKATALDGRRHGFEVFVIEDAVRGIEVRPGDAANARREMEAVGVKFVRSDEMRQMLADRTRGPQS